MAKKDTSADLTLAFKETLAKTKLINIEVEDELKKSFIAYAMAVNVSRAIPDVRDGLKPVHRRILYTMHGQGLYYDKAFKKCAKIVGDCLGKYHPHGDSSVYDALVRLAQDFSINFPLVSGHGNFGSVDGDSAAAYRYTEAKLSKLSNEMLKEIEKNTVDFYPNFDDTEMQPVVLPSRFPNILVNGSDGIAVGMATNIPPHNLAECLDGCIALLDNPELETLELMKHIPAPDFPTGGVLMGLSGLRQAYETGRGGVVLRAKCEIVEKGDSGRERILVTELPYQVNKAMLVKTIADYVKDKKIEGISDIRDESDRFGIRLVIDIKKDASALVVLNSLYKHTNLQTKVGIIMLALVDGEPKVLGIKDMLLHYLNHQKEVIRRRTKFDLEKAQKRAHILQGLVIALANIDEVIAIIKKSKEKNEAIQNLTTRFLIDDEQANAILEMRLQRLTSMEIDKLNEELRQLEELIKDLNDILANEYRIIDIIKNDMLEIKAKYPSPRKTEISYEYDGDIDMADLIEVQDVVVSLTNCGYIKRLPVKEYRSQRRGGRGVTAHKPKEEDYVENMIITSTHDTVMFFTNKGKVFTLMGYEIPEAQQTARGRAIINLLQLTEGEKVQAMIPINRDVSGYVMLATKKGLIKRTALTEFESIRKVGKIAITIVDDDELVSVQFTNGENELIIASHEGKCIRFNENDVRVMGRTAQGVKSMNLNQGDYVVDMTVLKEGYEVLTVSEYGYGKRSEIDDYRLQQRSGKGIKAGVFNEQTGKLVSLKLISKDYDIMMIADNGIIIRMAAEDISKIGRNTKGVRVMKLQNDSKIAVVAVTPSAGESEEIIEESANGEAVIEEMVVPEITETTEE